eukprot:TRINITY_DN276_c2_g1_i2.p1 TRINITY_DN276_c2_g1~~TRINITY_DN276_c2_g1_i2.p1  ORF type:complete len:661 (-),score=253.92 TRINITY_DN276_c2_g1_i2:740-2524(-)
MAVAAKPTKLPSANKLRDLSQSAFPDVPEDGYDLVVLGSGPGGEAISTRAAQLSARVAVVEIKRAFGGPTGLTSKAVREATKQIVQAVDQVGGDRRRQIRRLWRMRYPALRGEAEVLQAAETRDRLARNGVDLFIGSAELVPAHASMSGSLAVRVCRPTGCVELPASKVCIATGSRAHRPKEIAPGVAIPFTKGIVVDSTEMGQIAELPNAVAILGGGVIAVEYATVLARLGVGVSLLCQDKDFMSFLTEELRDALRKRMVRDRVLFVNAKVRRIDVGSDKLVRVLLEEQPRQPKRLRVDMVLYSGGRDANSEGLLCEAAGIEIGRFGRVMVDDTGCTANKDVYAVGDVVGAGLASAAAQQGRGVADRLFLDQMLRRARALLNTAAPLEDAIDDPFFASAAPAPPPPRTAEAPESIDDPFFASGAAAAAEKPDGEGDGTGRTLFGTAARAGTPLTLWTIPEIACVGLSEEAARELEVAGRLGGGGGGGDATVVVGYAYFKDLARGRLSGDPEGFLKIIARAEAPARHVVVGVHIMGEGANELIQLGSVLVHAGATLEQVGNTPFAAVTLSALYQVASDDALCRSPLNLQRVRAR